MAAGKGGAVSTLVYQRGTEVVSQVVSSKPGYKKSAGGHYLTDPEGALIPVRVATKTAKALRGTIAVGGHSFDTIERMDGYVALPGGQTYECSMELSPTHTGRRQIRPKHSKRNDKGKIAAILIHSGSLPNHFEGCIGVGVRSVEGLDESGKTMTKLLKLCGGFKVGRKVFLEVRGEMPGK